MGTRLTKSKPSNTEAESASETLAPATLPAALESHLKLNAASKDFVNTKPSSLEEVRKRVLDLNLRPTVDFQKLLGAVNRINPGATPAVAKMPEEVQSSLRAMKQETRRFHGSRVALSWFPFGALASPCSDRFGYMSPLLVRATTKLPFDAATQTLLGQLGDMMGNVGRDPNQFPQDAAGDTGNSVIPAGFTYFGQFVDHDITLDVSSSLDTATDANTIPNMRTPSLDLDSLYGRGPGLDPFLYVFPSTGPSTAVRLKTGANTPTGAGGPSSINNPSGMVPQTDWDVPRVAGTNTAIIGDPRNDENLIVVQFHHAMIRFHNAVVDLLLAASFAGDIFAEAKRIVIHHYQWAVVHDFLKRVCGAGAVSAAMASVIAPVGSPFRMPVEFAVAAYRFGHSMVRDNYWVNFNFPNATLGQVFEFSRNPRLPVFSNWVVDFNALFDTGLPVVPVHNKARKIDSNMAAGLESLPGFAGMMAVLATRNLRRALALGLPSGQGMAAHFGIPALTNAEIKKDLPADEVSVLDSNGGILLQKTPLWYYVLREAKVRAGGNQLGPVGARIVGETFVRILKRDATSYLNAAGGFAPMLPSAVPGDFTVADLVNFAGITKP